MIYYVLYELFYGHFKDKDWYLVKALNVFQYVTFRTAYASITALLLSLLFGGKLIEGLRRWNIGQQIREEGPQGHMAKRGTPTMGGALILVSIAVTTLLWGDLANRFVWVTLLVTVGYGAIGWVDDYRKVVRGNPKGMSAREKLFWQSLIGLIAATYLAFSVSAPDNVQLQRLFLDCPIPFRNILVRRGDRFAHERDRRRARRRRRGSARAGCGAPCSARGRTPPRPRA